MAHPITPLNAVILGIVEGLTEYLPVSSTGHLILASHLLGLDNPTIPADVQQGIKAYEIVIQAGAILAVLGLYWRHVQRMFFGLFGRDAGGRALLLQLFVAFLPSAVCGLLFGKVIKSKLFGPGPVIFAMIAGGILMLLVERWRRRRPQLPGVASVSNDLGRSASYNFGSMTLESMTWRAAVLIGLAQCLALWPGTSRSMVSIVAALLLGFSPVAAAQFSFLLALPTLGAATLYDFLKHRHDLLLASGPANLALGFVVSFIVALLAVKWLVAYLNRHGLTIFGYYRIVLGTILLLLSIS